MTDGIYISASAAVAIEKNMASVANNLANANTAGYRKDSAIFTKYIHQYRNSEIPEMMVKNGAPQDKSFTMIDDTYIDFRVGALKETGNVLDTAIIGDGFFKVKKNDEVYFQRSGKFTMNSAGILTGEDGATVLDKKGGQITLDPQKSLHINESGEIFQDQKRVAQLAVSTVDNKAWLEKAGDTRFKLTGDGKEIPAVGIEVRQGVIEGSNVNPLAEMVEMINVNRHYDTAAKAIKSYQDMDDKAINKVGTV